MPIITSSPLRYGRYRTTGDPNGTPPITYFGKRHPVGTILYVTKRMSKRYTINGKLVFVDNGDQQPGDILVKGGRAQRLRHREEA